MKPSPEPPAGTQMLEALRARAGGRAAIGFAEFMDVALFAPGLGYYRKDKARIGYEPGADFLTATTSGPIFGELVTAACAKLLGPLSSYAFVEIGAERGSGILEGASHPFRSARALGLGDPLEIEGPSVVFSNELFDAQPFRRFRFLSGRWRELGVSVASDRLSEVEIETGDPFPQGLPEDATEGYTLDAPIAAGALACAIAAQPWTGLFLAFDYGKSWEEIIHDAPAGTARAYRHHVQSNDLLANPGDQDLTCHVCWDWLKDGLSRAGFNEPRVESQESFFARHSGAFIEPFTQAEAGRVTRAKLSLLQLLHPAHMGQKFQVLWAVRPSPGNRPLKITLPTDPAAG